MNKILLITCICIILLVGSVSAFEFDNRKGDLIIDETTSRYGRIEIKDWFGLLDLATLELKTNTDKCLIECSAEKEIIMYQKGSLIDEIRFETLNSDGSRTKEPIKKQQFYVRENNKWVKYKLGTEVEPGTYQVKLEGKKSISKTVDWIIKSQGIWINEWTIWETNQPLVYFSFDESSGTVLPNLINSSNNGTLVGMDNSDWVGGILNNALRFNLTAGQYVNVSNNEQLNPPYIAISFWVNVSFWGGNDMIYRKGDVSTDRQYWMYTDGSGSIGTLTAHVENIGLTTSELEPNTWYHIVRTYNSTGHGIYINGELNASNAGTAGTIDINDSSFYFNYPASAFSESNVTIDEFAIFENLTLAEITELYNSGNPPSYSPGADIFVTLNSPEVNHSSLEDEIEFNCSVIALSGATLINISLWHNGSGVFTNNQTIDITGISNQTDFNTTITESTITLWTCGACDSDGACDFAFENRTIERVNLIINNETFNENTIEGSSEDFILNVTLKSGITITEASFVYNGSSSIAQIFSFSGYDIIRKIGFIIPNIEARTNKSFNWFINLSDSSSVITPLSNHTITNISISDCTSLTNNIFNFTLVDEKNQNLLSDNITIETAFNIFSVDRTINIGNFSSNFSSNPISICLNRNLLGNTNYSLDAIIKYEAQDHVNEYYNIANFSLTNLSEFQNITLFDLLSADSTEFKLSFTGTDFLPAEDVLVFVERQYISENTFKTVELPKTDTNGQTILHLVVNEIIYNLIFVKDGIVLKNFRNLIAFCDDPTISDCSISLNALSEEDDITTYDQELGIAYVNPPTYNSSTNRISFAFTSIDGSVKEVVMRVERRDVFGNNSICDNSINSISGVLSCNIGSGITDTTLVTTISVDGNDKIISEVVIDNSAYGNFGYVAWFFLALGLVLVFSKDKNGILIALLISYIGAAGLGFIVGGIIGVGSAGIWIIIITLIGLWRLNKNKFD